MKTLILALTLISNVALADKPNYIVISGITSPADYIDQNKDKESWFAYQVKAQKNTKSMCCWENIDSDNKQCYLDKDNSSFGSSNTDGITKNINVYVKVKKGSIKNMFTIGDQCKVVTGKQQVNWLNDINQQKSIAWLKNLSLNGNEKTSDNAIASLSDHQDKQASEALFDIATLNNQNKSSNAIFWLGHSRNDGVDYLQKLYKELPTGNVKRHINFALSQSKSSKALGVLKHIAKTDKDTEQRADAYFWLAEENSPGIEDLLLSAVKNDQSQTVREKAIFGLSQVKSEKADSALLNLVENSKNSSTQEKALFWLAQKAPLKAKGIVLNILKTAKSEDQIKNAVFVLSQIAEQTSDHVLFSLLTENYSTQVKKQALFWLSQSEDSKTIEKLQSLL